MSKTKPRGNRPHKGPGRSGSSDPAPARDARKPGREPSAPQPARPRLPSSAAVRETIESVVVAFVLAFLFRTFEAEAFVIPTGSMAPTLMGRHKDLVCPICGYSFQASASDEVDENGRSHGSRAWVQQCTCPMCRYPLDLGPGNPHRRYPSFKGDRILVGKFSYEFSEPKRWDVAVFKYPGEAKTNFIKRLVGLPGEVVWISRGDIYVTRLPKAGEDLRDLPRTIARKPPAKLLAMLQPVFDNEVAPKILEHGWPPRWRASPGDSPGAWQAGPDRRCFQTDGTANGVVWLRYEHRVPSHRQWEDVIRGARPPEEIRPRLISDFSAYNTSRPRGKSAPDRDAAGLHWVGDLALSCALEAKNAGGAAIFELVEGGRRMQCRLELDTGEASLSIDGQQDFHPVAQTDVRGPGRHEITFSNCDDQLLLWVDGDAVVFDGPTTFGPLGNTCPQPADLAPVGIAAAEEAELRVSQLKIFRDIYYIAEGHRRYPTAGPITDFPQLHLDHRVLAEPSMWEDAFRDLKEVYFVLAEPDHPDRRLYLALGDNSAKSKDGRLWEQEGFPYYVDGDLLIGKALYIYWPHSWDKLPGTDIPFPFFPNFQRMGFVR